MIDLQPELCVDPDRLDQYNAGELPLTGIFVRAAQGNKYGNYDISTLTAPSLLYWLKSRGGNNPWAENTVGILLGHERRLHEN